jgi:hypothetical protein
MGPAGNNQIAGNTLITKGSLAVSLTELAAPGTVFFNNMGAGDLGGASGAVVAIPNARVVPSANPAGGGVLYAQAGAMKWRSSTGDTFDTTRRTVTGAKGSNAALASLLSALSAAGLITDNTTA